MITNRCPHDEDTPVGGLCGRCEEEGVGLVELDADGEGIATFLVPLSQGLKPKDYEDLLSKEELDEALVRRKLMTDEEVEEAMLRPYEEDPEAVEEDAYEDELAWKLTDRLADLVGDEWRRATLYVIPDPPGTTSWAGTLLSASPQEVRAALETRTDTEH
jgi:hypothetical protein